MTSEEKVILIKSAMLELDSLKMSLAKLALEEVENMTEKDRNVALAYIHFPAGGLGDPPKSSV